MVEINRVYSSLDSLEVIIRLMQSELCSEQQKLQAGDVAISLVKELLAEFRIRSEEGAKKDES